MSITYENFVDIVNRALIERAEKINSQPDIAMMCEALIDEILDIKLAELLKEVNKIL